MEGGSGCTIGAVWIGKCMQGDVGWEADCDWAGLAIAFQGVTSSLWALGSSGAACCPSKAGCRATKEAEMGSDKWMEGVGGASLSY